MADDSETDAEKTEEPSSHRIEEFRRRGEVASSKELTSVIVLAASLLTFTLSLVLIYETLSDLLMYVYSLDHSVAFTDKAFKTLSTKVVIASLKCVGPLFIVVVCVAILASVSQVGILFASEALELKLERVNPISGFKRLFSMRSLVEAAKGVFKFSIVLSIVFFYLKDDINSYIGFLHLGYSESFFYGKDILIKLGLSIIAGLVVVALGDFSYQKFTYKKKLMMTKEQAKRETKEHEGNPEIRQKIKTIQRDMAQKRMMADIPNADVIITNPTHLSIAIKYNPSESISPLVIAKGSDYIAMKIREIAKANDIPLVENVPLARTLWKAVKIGDTIPRNLYKAVAEVLAFVYKIKKRKKSVS